jgi:hypothetical protein
MKYYNNDILTKNIITFEIPYEKDSNPGIKLNSETQKVYLGDKIPESSTIVKIEVEECDSDVYLPEPNNKYLRFVKLSYEAKNGEKKDVNFGGFCIMESMAHIAQNLICKTSHNVVPYQTAKLVANEIYDEIGKNDLFVFALCDACLMTYQPGVTFLRVLKVMKDEQFVPRNEYAVFDFVFKFTLEGIPLLSHFSWLSGFANLQLLGYFTTPLFNNEKIWIDSLLKNAHKLRVKNPYFLIELINDGPISHSKIMELVSSIGTPLMFNSKGESWFTPPAECHALEIHPDRLSAIFEIFRLFEFGRAECGLTDYCNLHGTEIVDERCDYPWERCNDAKLCAYGAQWKTWKLTEFTPIKSKED